MRVSELLAAQLDGVREVLDVSRGPVDLVRHYQLPEEVTYRRGDPAVVRDDPPGAEQLLVGLVGSQPSVHVLPEELAVLADCRPGHRSVLLLGWPIVDLPTHLLLSALTSARCQILETVPLSTANIRGVYAALVVARVDRPAATRRHLEDAAQARRAAHAPPGRADDPRTLLRMVNEYQLTDLVHRPLRGQLRELRAEVERQRELLAQRDDRLRELERELAAYRPPAQRS
ncbi:hypothetical protein [Micromonospora sp. NBC_00617]|uniref:hypothetical protein n=1 Tax=Micromonospora sp. NBC_00617 TaxID=2903587 RepID=UPI0030DF6FE0